MRHCFAESVIGVLSTIASMLTAGVLFLVFLLAGILIKPVGGSNFLHTLCIVIAVVAAILFIFMLYASWTRGRCYRITQVIICLLCTVFYLIVIIFLLGPIDIIVDFLKLIWTSKSLDGSQYTVERYLKCCGYEQIPQRCYNKTLNPLLPFSYNTISNKSIKEFELPVIYDCRDAALDLISVNFKIILPLTILFFLYVITSAIFFIILLCMHYDDQVEAISDDAFDSSDDSFFSASSKEFNTENEIDSYCKNISSSPLVPTLDEPSDPRDSKLISLSDEYTNSPRALELGEMSEHSEPSEKQIMLGERPELENQSPQAVNPLNQENLTDYSGYYYSDASYGDHP